MRSLLFVTTLPVLLATVSCGDDALAPIAPPPFGSGSWTLAVMPDTQYYVVAFPEIFEAQTRWLVQSRDQLRVAYVVHEGDVVDNDVAEQWDRASRSMHLMDGLLPYSLLPGNHDYDGAGGVTSRATMMNDYFPVTGFSWNPSLREVFEEGHIENSLHQIEVDGRSYVLLSLEFGPRDAVVAWAKGALARYSSSIAIVVTHAYQYNDGTRYDWARKGPAQDWNPHSYLDKLGEHVNDGQELWDNLIAPSANVRLVLSGHAIGVGRSVGQRDGASPVHEIMADYQGEANGGDGWLRLMEFTADGKVNVRTFSPTQNRYRTEPGHQFVIDLGDDNAAIASPLLSAGQSATVPPQQE